MCATSGVGNAGIDSSKIGIAYRLDMPETVSDLFQEKGWAGQYANALPSENRYILSFSIEDLLYFFKQTMDPEEEVMNDNYRKSQVSDLLKMAKVLATDECINSQIEKLIGNPEMEHHQPEPCGDCATCKNKMPFFRINKEGTKSILLDLFVFGDPGIDGKPHLKGLVKSIKAYPNVRAKIVSGSRSRLGMQPGEIKKLHFVLVAHGLLKLHYEPRDKHGIFALQNLIMMRWF